MFVCLGRCSYQRSNPAPGPVGTDKELETSGRAAVGEGDPHLARRIPLRAHHGLVPLDLLLRDRCCQKAAQLYAVDLRRLPALVELQQLLSLLVDQHDVDVAPSVLLELVLQARALQDQLACCGVEVERAALLDDVCRGVTLVDHVVHIQALQQTSERKAARSASNNRNRGCHFVVCKST